MTDVLQYLLGAGILGVLVTQLGNTWRAWRERQRERRGLLRILFTEVSLNRGSIEILHFLFYRAGEGDPKAERDLQSAPSALFDGMQTQTWMETRVKLAQGLSTKEFATLASYFQALIAAKVIVDKGMESIDTYRTIRFTVNRLHELGQEVDQVIHAHVPDIEEVELTGEDLERLGYTEEDQKRLGYE